MLVAYSRDREPTQREAIGGKAYRPFASIKVGDPFDPDMQKGPLAMHRQREKVEYYIKKGVEQGARVTVGGKRPPHLTRGFYIEPTILAMSIIVPWWRARRFWSRLGRYPRG